jgi:signal transduction histidine kinase/ligand-binding sensor domain-containing protein
MKNPNAGNQQCEQMLRDAVIFVLALTAQNLFAQSRSVKFEHIGMEQGLSQSTVYCILQDRQGFMWFGTQGGLNKYDGYGFIVYKKDVFDSTSLSWNDVPAIHEDHAGTLWVGTSGGGLHRFDREKEQFTRFVYDSNNPQSLSHNSVSAVYEDRSGVLWVGTNDGLNRFDRDKKKFARFLYDPKDPNSLQGNSVFSIYEDRSGTLWIGTERWLNKFDRQKEQFTHYEHDPQNPPNTRARPITAILEDRYGTLWIGTRSAGLKKFDRGTGQFTHFFHDPNNSRSLSNDRVQAIYEDRTGTLWIGTWGGGLNQFDRNQKHFTRFFNDPKNPRSLVGNFVMSIHEDRSGRLWVGTFFTGISTFDPAKEQFTQFVKDPYNPNGLRGNAVLSFHEDQAGTLWIGCSGLARLSRDNRDTKQFGYFVHDPNNPKSLSHNNVSAICEDEAGMLWVGTLPGGLNKFDCNTKQFTHFVHDPKNPQSLSDNGIWTIYQDAASRNTLWIGTQGGLNKFDRDTAQFTRYVHDPKNPHSLSGNVVWAICRDSASPHTLWLGTSGGLNRFDYNTEQFTHFVHDPTNPHSLSHNRVYAICEDPASPDVLWLGTSDGGLNRFDRNTQQFSYYTEKDGLPNNTICGILMDEHGRLWLSTDNGLSCFDPQTKIFHNYNMADGLPYNEFHAGAYYKSKSGEMFFGSFNGFIAFHPDKIKDNPYIPPVVITAFQRYNTEAAEGKPIIEKGISIKQAITLSYKDNILAFEFAALSYRNSFKNQYAYKLAGFNDNWIQLGIKRGITFTNLDPGEYTLHVKGSNSDGVWNEEGASLKITITPPWWLTRWAYAIYALLVMAGVFATDRFQRRRLLAKERVQAQIREAELHAQTAEAQAKALQAENARKEVELQKAAELKAAYQELDAAHTNLKATQQQLITQEKLASLGQLTAGIAHEIKNPLNFVNNFAQLSAELTDEFVEQLNANADKTVAEVRGALEDLLADLRINNVKIHEHGKRADSIVRAMMQHARGGKGERQPTDVNKLVEEYVNLTYHGMRAKVPDFNVSIEQDFGELDDKIEMVPQDIGRVLLNLLGNAFDAVRERAQTADGSCAPKVAVSTRFVDGGVEIRVSDNGCGVPDDLRERIFEPFFTTKPAGSGTGLGLSLSYDIITQGHGGTLTVESTKGEGATFIITLPKNKISKTEQESNA